jgi:hypothetical protein
MNDTIITFALRYQVTLPMTAQQYEALSKMAAKALKLKPLKIKA